MKGLTTFVKYALPPNLLRYCGPEESGALLNVADKKNLRRLLSQFEGAVPYLRLIAVSNGITDEFDERVVEAYWLGNDLLRRVADKNLYSNLEERFKNRMSNKDWAWLVYESVPSAKPFHAFHVFDIYRRAGLLKSGTVGNILETINNCRIGWGVVVATEFNTGLIIEYSPLVFKNSKLVFGEKTIKKLVSLDSSIKMGDEVSFHWNHVCEKITPRQQKNLYFWTRYHLDLTNRTI